MQANARNKRLLFDGIDQLVDRAIAYFGKALEFAYQKLENFERTQEGAGKNIIILGPGCGLKLGGTYLYLKTKEMLPTSNKSILLRIKIAGSGGAGTVESYLFY